MKRLLYLLYYLKETNFKQIRSFIQYSSNKSGKSKFRIIADVIVSVFRYNISIKDYFCFRFYEKSHRERQSWAGTGYMYEYQLVMNPRHSRDVLENKIKFLNHFKAFVKRSFYELNEIRTDESIAKSMLEAPSGKLVLKGSCGQVGAEVEVVAANNYSPQSLVQYMELKNFDLAEEYVVQEKSLMELSPSGLNTVRVFTQLHEGEVDILGARLRITINSSVDNMAAGNPAAPIDLLTGMVNGPGVFSDIIKPDVTQHPVTHIPIVGFQVPFWKELVTMVKEAARQTPENKSIGWDVAISDNGPELIEGNHNWCKLLWQLPVKKGLKPELEKYL